MQDEIFGNNFHMKAILLDSSNAINFYAKIFLSDVILTGQSDMQLAASAQRWLRDIINGQSSVSTGVSPECLTFNGDVNVRKALLLVGSPRGHKNNSNSLGSYLFERLSDQDIETETIYIYNTLRSVGKMEGLMNALNEADLIVLVFPLYVDSLPAPLIDVLERICAERQGKENRRQLFAAVANCGFPEAQHNITALSICEMFAREAGFEWAGSLAMGGGEAIGGAPLIMGGGRTMRIRKSLDIAAEALGKGHAIPKAASELMAKPMIPHWVYRMMGALGWKKQAKRYGADEALKNKPYSMNS